MQATTSTSQPLVGSSALTDVVMYVMKLTFATRFIPRGHPPTIRTHCLGYFARHLITSVPEHLSLDSYSQVLRTPSLLRYMLTETARAEARRVLLAGDSRWFDHLCHHGIHYRSQCKPKRSNSEVVLTWLTADFCLTVYCPCRVRRHLRHLRERRYPLR
jgi:hypothetical protein